MCKGIHLQFRCLQILYYKIQIMGNICCPEQNTIPPQALPQRNTYPPSELILPHIQYQPKQQALDFNGQAEPSPPFFLHHQHQINCLRQSRSEQIDHEDKLQEYDSIFPLHTHSMPVAVRQQQAMSGMSNKSYKDSVSYIKHYNKPVKRVHPPSLIENSVQLSVFDNSYKLSRLISSNLQLSESYHLLPVIQDNSLLQSSVSKN